MRTPQLFSGVNGHTSHAVTPSMATLTKESTVDLGSYYLHGYNLYFNAPKTTTNTGPLTPGHHFLFVYYDLST